MTGAPKGPRSPLTGKKLAQSTAKRISNLISELPEDCLEVTTLLVNADRLPIRLEVTVHDVTETVDE
jgi:hypothetical protein